MTTPKNTESTAPVDDNDGSGYDDDDDDDDGVDLGLRSTPPHIKLNGDSAIVAFLTREPSERYWQGGMEGEKLYAEHLAIDAGLNKVMDERLKFIVSVPLGKSGDGSPILRRKESPDTHYHDIAYLEVKGLLRFAFRDVGIKVGRFYRIERTGSGRKTAYKVFPLVKPEDFPKSFGSPADAWDAAVSGFRGSDYYNGEPLSRRNRYR